MSAFKAYCASNDSDVLLMEHVNDEHVRLLVYFKSGETREESMPVSKLRSLVFEFSMASETARYERVGGDEMSLESGFLIPGHEAILNGLNIGGLCIVLSTEDWQTFVKWVLEL